MGGPESWCKADIVVLLLLLLPEINEGVVVSPLRERPGEVDCSICPVRRRGSCRVGES